MESRPQPEIQTTYPTEAFKIAERQQEADLHPFHRMSIPQHGRKSDNIERLASLQREMEYLNTIGKSFVAANDRFQVHRALLKALQELYSFSACCILLKGDTYQLFIIPCYPLNSLFLADMIQRIANAADAINFPNITARQLAQTAYFDAPDDVAQPRTPQETAEAKI